jgi:hypothetical protein
MHPWRNRVNVDYESVGMGRDWWYLSLRQIRVPWQVDVNILVFRTDNFYSWIERKRRQSCPDPFVLWTRKCYCKVDRQTWMVSRQDWGRAMKGQSRAALSHLWGWLGTTSATRGRPEATPASRKWSGSTPHYESHHPSDTGNLWRTKSLHATLLP